MGVRVEVMSCDAVAKAKRKEAAERVLKEKEFDGKLPDLELLAFFDDCDWAELKSPQSLGLGNRGFLHTDRQKHIPRLPELASWSRREDLRYEPLGPR